MGDNQHRAAPILEEGFQPLYRVDIEVIGGLIQKEQIRAFEKQAGKHSARALPA